MREKLVVEGLMAHFNFCSNRSREIAESLLTRAFRQDRHHEMVDRIGFHLSRAHDMPEEHQEGLKLARLYDERCGASQTLRSRSLETGCLFEDNTLGNEPLPPQPKIEIH